MQEKSKLKIDNLEAIESLIEQELTPEEADKIVGGKGRDFGKKYFDPGDSREPAHPDYPCYPITKSL